MEYRRLPRGMEKISVLGFGGSGIHQAGEKEAVETIVTAIEQGINGFDLAVSEATAFDAYRAAPAGRRDAPSNCRRKQSGHLCRRTRHGLNGT